jgi:S1-C subfamily serine protease
VVMSHTHEDTVSIGSSPVWSALSRELSDAADRVTHSIVQVHGRSRPASGIVWAADRVLSTSHSVEWEDGVRVRRHDGTIFPATIAGHDPVSDLVVLRVENLESPPLPHAGAAARAGDLALITGRAWNGRAHSRLVALTGVAGPLQSAHGPKLDRVITLPLSPYAGFSGSAVTGPDGTVLGLATAGVVRGRALALPVDLVQPIVEAIEKHGGIRRGYLGVVTQPVRLPARQRGDLPDGRGLLVIDVSPDSPAEAAGVLVGDIIVGAAEGALSAPEDLLALLGPGRIGEPLPLDVLRGSARETVHVVVGERLRHR